MASNLPPEADKGLLTRRMHMALARGDYDECLSLPDNFPGEVDAAMACFTLVAAGEIAAEASELHEADRCFNEASEIGLPVRAVLLRCGSYLKSRGDYIKAFDCFVRLDHSQPGVLARFFVDLPPSALARYAPQALRHAVSGRFLNIELLKATKEALVEAFGVDATAIVFAESLGGPGWKVSRLPLVGLQEYAEGSASQLYEVIPAKAVRVRWPEVVGHPRGEEFDATSRSLFCSVLPNMKVSSKSNLLLSEDSIVLDHMGTELSRVSVDLHINPEVLWEHGGDVAVMDLGTESIQVELESAFSLVGLRSAAWGHWMFEQMFRLWACATRPEFDGVPVLIDKGVPPQVRQSVEFFVGDDRQIVELEQGKTAVVRNLWACSRIAYWPGGVNTKPVGYDSQLSDYEGLAHLVSGLQPALDRVARPDVAERLYLTRSNRHRPLLNRSEVEEYFEQVGFVVADLAELDFAEQVALIRGANVIAMEGGSNIYGALCFSRPGTELVELGGPPLHEYLWICNLAAALGHQHRVVPFRDAFTEPIRPTNDAFLLDLDTLRPVIER